MPGPIRDGGGRFARTGQAAEVGAAAERMVAEIAKALVLRIDANLRRNPGAGGTPVDTGHARANWIHGIGAPARIEANDSSPHDAAVAAVLAYELGQGPLYLSNNVDYIQLLNRGHSDQADVGFIEAAIDEAMVEIQAEYGGPIDLTGLRARFQGEAGGVAASNLAAAFDPFGGDF